MLPTTTETRAFSAERGLTTRREELRRMLAESYERLANQVHYKIRNVRERDGWIHASLVDPARHLKWIAKTTSISCSSR
jgi:hypothetical protein